MTEQGRRELSITYLSELSADYAKALGEATTLETLRSLLTDWRRVADDAREIVAGWTEGDFKDWRKALASERRGNFMGEDAAARFALVLMPDVLFAVQTVASKYKASWGCTFIRMKEHGMITEQNGIASAVRP